MPTSLLIVYDDFGRNMTPLAQAVEEGATVVTGTTVKRRLVQEATAEDMLIGCAMGPFFILGTTGAAQALTGASQLVFAALIVAALAGAISTLRGMTRVGAAIGVAAGIALLAMPTFTGKPVTYFPGVVITVGSIIAFFYKEPVMTGSQWRMRRGGTSSGTGTSPEAGTGAGTPPASTS